MSLATSTPQLTHWLVNLWESGWCLEEDYFPSRTAGIVEATDRDNAVSVAFKKIFPQGKIIPTPRGGEKGPYFIAFFPNSMTNDCGLITIVGRYRLLKAKSKKQCFAYLGAVTGSYPDWVERVTAKKNKKVIVLSPLYLRFDPPIWCLNCGTPIKKEQDECPVCGEEINHSARI